MTKICVNYHEKPHVKSRIIVLHRLVRIQKKNYASRNFRKYRLIQR